MRHRERRLHSLHGHVGKTWRDFPFEHSALSLRRNMRTQVDSFQARMLVKRFVKTIVCPDAVEGACVIQRSVFLRRHLDIAIQTRQNHHTRTWKCIPTMSYWGWCQLGLWRRQSGVPIVRLDSSNTWASDTVPQHDLSDVVPRGEMAVGEEFKWPYNDIFHWRAQVS